jgi:hypothetical protein
MLNIDINSLNLFLWDVEAAERAYDFPSDLLSLCPDGQTKPSSASIKDVASKLRLLNNRKAQGVNEDGIDVLFDFSKAEFISTVKIDNMADKQTENHVYLDQEKYPHTKILFRLIRSA